MVQKLYLAKPQGTVLYVGWEKILHGNLGEGGYQRLMPELVREDLIN